MYDLVHAVFGTAIPTCLYLFAHFLGILTKDVVLTNVYQMLANKSAKTKGFLLHIKGREQNPFKKSQTLQIAT